ALTEQRLNFAVPPQSTLCSSDLLQNRYIQPWVSRARSLQLATALSLARFSREASLSCAVERACAVIASLHVLAWAGASARTLMPMQTRPSLDGWSTMFTRFISCMRGALEPRAGQTQWRALPRVRSSAVDEERPGVRPAHEVGRPAGARHKARRPVDRVRRN